MSTNEDHAQLVEYKGKFYRTSWMLPVGGNLVYQYINNITLLPISHEEYNILKIAIKNHEDIPAFEEEEELPDPIDVSELENIRNGKLKEMSTTCRKTIENGFDLELRGENHHFSLNTQDQLNLMSLGLLAQTQSLIPYHADGEECVFYTSEEMNEIIDSANAFKIYHTTYYNALKAYINSLQTVEAIGAIEYGVEIPEEYKTDVLKMLEQ